MMKLLIAASLGWLAVGKYVTVPFGSTCERDGYLMITDAIECRDAFRARGEASTFQTVNNGYFPPGCSSDGLNAYLNSNAGSYCGRAGVDCLCIDPNAGGGGGGSGAGGAEDKVCIDVRKKKACKALSYCNFDKGSSPMCTDVNPGEKIPIKEFCEIIPTRGWCKRVDECMWMGDKCMLKSEAGCRDISKRRICQPFRSKNGGCLNGKNCFWTGQVCLEVGAGC